MTQISTYIYLRDVRFHAFHGVMPQEQAVGADFTVNVRVGYDFTPAFQSDDVADTLNYAAVYECLRQEMAQPSRLLEHVAGRMADVLLRRFPAITTIDLTLTKDNPPMGADSAGAGVEIHLINDKTAR